MPWVIYSPSRKRLWGEATHWYNRDFDARAHGFRMEHYPHSRYDNRSRENGVTRPDDGLWAPLMDATSGFPTWRAGVDLRHIVLPEDYPIGYIPPTGPSPTILLALLRLPLVPNQIVALDDDALWRHVIWSHVEPVGLDDMEGDHLNTSRMDAQAIKEAVAQLSKRSECPLGFGYVPNACDKCVYHYNYLFSEKDNACIKRPIVERS